MEYLLNCDICVVGQVGLGIQRQEEVDLLLGSELGGDLSRRHHLLLLGAAVDEVFHLQRK